MSNNSPRSTTRFEAELRTVKAKRVKVQVDIIEYQEDGVYFVFSPALDLVGYGKSFKEARDSWETVLEQYINYTMNKNTLIKDLQLRGWTIGSQKKNKESFTPPTFSWMIENHKEVKEIYDNRPFKKRSQNVEIPAFA